MSKPYLRITVNNACDFASNLDVDPADAAHHAQQLVDVTAWAYPDAVVVGELTVDGRSQSLHPTGEAGPSDG